MNNFGIFYLVIICVALITFRIVQRSFLIENKCSHVCAYLLLVLVCVCLLYFYEQLQLRETCILSANEIESSLDAILNKCSTKIQFVKWSLANNPSMPQLLKYDVALLQIDKMLSGFSHVTDAQLSRIESMRELIHELRIQIANMRDSTK